MNRNVTVVLILGSAAFGYYWWTNLSNKTGTDQTVSNEMANYTTPADIGGQNVSPTYGLPSSATVSYGQTMPLPMTNTMGS